MKKERKNPVGRPSLWTEKKVLRAVHALCKGRYVPAHAFPRWLYELSIRYCGSIRAAKWRSGVLSEGRWTYEKFLDSVRDLCQRGYLENKDWSPNMRALAKRYCGTVRRAKWEAGVIRDPRIKSRVRHRRVRGRWTKQKFLRWVREYCRLGYRKPELWPHYMRELAVRYCSSTRAAKWQARILVDPRKKPRPSFRRKPESSCRNSFLGSGLRRNDGLGVLIIFLCGLAFASQGFGAPLCLLESLTFETLDPNRPEKITILPKGRVLKDESETSSPPKCFASCPNEKDHSVLVTPPGSCQITAKTCADFNPAYIVLFYDDLQSGLDIPLRLENRGKNIYSGQIEFQPSRSAKNKEGDDIENFYPREYAFKKLDGHKLNCSAGWAPVRDLTPLMWEKCLEKSYSEGYWTVRCHNGQSEIWFQARDFESFKSYFGREERVRAWVNLSVESEAFVPMGIAVQVTSLSHRLQKVSDETGVWRSVPELDSAQVVWEGRSISLQEGQNFPIQKGSDSFRIRWKMRDEQMNIQPMSLHLALFRPTKNGQTLLDSGGEYQYLDVIPPESSWKGGEWQEWVVSADSFKSVGSQRSLEPGFRSGLYTLKLFVTNFAGNAIDKLLSFTVLGDVPELKVAESQQKGIDGIEFSFARRTLNTRFDVSAAVSSSGPFQVLTRDVIDSPPPPVPWSPFTAPTEERWEFMADNSQNLRVNFSTIRQVLQARSLPEKIYFRFRAIDEVGNVYIGEPYLFPVKRLDLHKPVLTVEQMEGESVRITDLGEFPILKGTLRDRSPWGSKNVVTLYLDIGDVTLASTTLTVADPSPVFWTLPIPEDKSILIPNGIHSVQLRSVDSDGNESTLPLKLEVDLVPFDLQIPNPLYTRSFPLETEGKKRSFIDLKAKVKENSFLTMSVDGKTWFKNLFTGNQRELQTRFYNDSNLSEGAHEGILVLERGDQRKEVPFQLIVDVQPPLLKNVRRLNIKETLFSSRETAANIFSRKEIGVAVDVQDDRSTVTVRVALANSFEDLNKILSIGLDKVFPGTGTTISLPENRLTYLGLIA
ncbi:MAG: hypothetical protein HYY07_00810, partial [Elusimicrobia bacterium]|nr:hypothetical protein [Elusimicrobiota bacterium]